MPKSRAPGRGGEETSAAGVPAVAGSSASSRAGASRPDGVPAAGASRLERFRPRPVIEHVTPEVDGGRFPAKAVAGDEIVVEADVFADGHDLVGARLQVRRAGQRRWTVVPMTALGDDRWRGRFVVDSPGRVEFAVTGWVDSFGTWRRDLVRTAEAGQEVAQVLQLGHELVARVAASTTDVGDRKILDYALSVLGDAGRRSGTCGLAQPVGGVGSGATLADVVLGDDLSEAVARCRIDDEVTGDLRLVDVEVELARSGSWYELFPRSASPDPDRPGTLADVIGRVPAIAAMGFDVLYLPPIHPIGTTARKGRNGVTVAAPGDPGSPWAIGSEHGGHMSVHPELGSLADVERLVETAAVHGMQIALDLAFQCSPDHPWVREHPSWFRRMPDGSFRTAENPPKRYEDIYPLDFDSDDWAALWAALRDVVFFWIECGITVFRCDNPHTKPFGFWEWLIGTVRAEYPATVFLSEAFTRPPVMKRLAKVGFSQSYTYFTWRHTKYELEAYLTELVTPPVADYLRPNLWPNTPDILARDLQNGSVASFCARLVLAATLAASYGIYGPAFELREHVARDPGSEEYLDSEKYEIRHWVLDRPDTLAPFITRVNEIRRDHQALRRNDGLRFLSVDNDQLIAFAKSTVDVGGDVVGGGDIVVVVVNLDPAFTQSGWLHLDSALLGLESGRPITAHDLLTNAHFRWRDGPNFVMLDPSAVPAHILHLRHDVADPLPTPTGADALPVST